MTDGRIIGHEAVDTVQEVGAGVDVKVKDRVLVSCISACGAGRFCTRPLRAVPRRRGSTWQRNQRYRGGVRAGSLRRQLDLPGTDGVSDEELLMFTDILPTGYEVGCSTPDPARERGRGSGRGPDRPVGDDRARLFTQPRHRDRLAASPTRRRPAIRRRRRDHNSREDPIARVLAMTDGLGADVAIEAVESCDLELTAHLVRRVGRVANVGCTAAP